MQNYLKNKEDNSITLTAIDNSAINKPMKPLIQTCLLVAIALNPILINSSKKAIALPPPEDIPEEVLRTEIILEVRSPIDGKPFSSNDYEELKAELSQSPNSPLINSDIQELIFLLQLRKLVKTIIPFY